MAKLNTNIKQSSRYYMHSCFEEQSTGFTKLPYVELAINITANVSTDQTPSMLIHGAKVRLPLILLLAPLAIFLYNNLLTRSLSSLNKLVK